MNNLSSMRKPSAPTRLRLASPFPEELTLATVLTGVKEPLKSQLQLKLGPKTGYSQVREWILQYENMNAPWSQAFVKAGKGNDGGPQPMEVDVIKGKKGKAKGGGKTKGKDSKGKSKDNKGKSYNPTIGKRQGLWQPRWRLAPERWLEAASRESQRQRKRKGSRKVPQLWAARALEVGMPKQREAEGHPASGGKPLGDRIVSGVHGKWCNLDGHGLPDAKHGEPSGGSNL